MDRLRNNSPPALRHRYARWDEYSFRRVIERDVELENVDARLAKDPERAPIGGSGDEIAHPLGRSLVTLLGGCFWSTLVPGASIP